MIYKKVEEIKLSKELSFIYKLILNNKLKEPKNLDWNRIFKLVQKNRILPLVVKSIDEKFPLLKNSNNAVINDLIKLNNKESIICMHQISTLSTVMRDLEKSGINAFLFKGFALSKKIFDNVSYRQSRDIDIWVDEKHIIKALLVLSKNGWHTIPRSANTKKRFKCLKTHFKLCNKKHFELFHDKIPDICIELHWSINNNNQSFRKLWKKRSYINLSGVKIACIDETSITYLTTIHNALHLFYRQRWLFDTYFILKIKNVSYSKLWKISEQSNTQIYLLSTFMLLLNLPYFSLDNITLNNIRITKCEKGIKIIYDKSNSNLINEAIEIYNTMKNLLEEVHKNPFDCILYNKFQDKYFFQQIPRNIKTILLNFITPRETEWEKWNLPDLLYFLYYPIRMFNVVYITLKCCIKKKN